MAGEWRTADRPLLTSGSFPDTPQAIWAVHRDLLWSLELRSNRLEVVESMGWCDDFFSREKLNSWGHYKRQPAQAPQPSLAEYAQRKIPWLLAWGLGSTPALSYRVDDPAQSERLQVFALATTPPGFQLQSTPRISQQSGYVIYAWDVPPPTRKAE